MPKRYLVTAALPYSNGRLHVGHIAGAYVPADIYVRYLRASGAEVRFICGSDDNGAAIEISAMQEGRSPQEICTQFHLRQKADFESLSIDFDIYGGTHQPEYREMHEQFSQEFFRRIHEKGYFSKRRTKQLYDPVAQRFLPDRYVRGKCHYSDCGAPGATGDQCDTCGRMIDPLLLIEPVSVITPGQRAEVRETVHWYLKLNDLEQPLQNWLETKRGQWRVAPLNFALGQIKQGLPERAMTRDISWGIPVPLDDPDAHGKVLFVWFDAPIGYVSFTAAHCAKADGDWRAYEKWWADPETCIVHFIGEDNTVFHSLTWPAMMMADGRYQLPSFVVVNNFLNFRVNEEFVKISKSSTPADSPVWVQEYVKHHDADALRYYLTAIAPETARTAFDEKSFAARNDNELVAALGNFINRGLSFASKYLNNAVPGSAAQSEADREIVAKADAALQAVAGHIERHAFRAALEEMMAFARVCNEYFGKREPWKTRKTDPPACEATIATCVHLCQYLAVMMYPFLPNSAAKLRRTLRWSDGPVRWVAPEPLPAGHEIETPQVLFRMIQTREGAKE
ncbi:MAG: methionine--tRNA ligase [Phycisphaerales bacterium]|nr:methionine--tRNA ligase [Phycisphaerales bacterium]